MSFIDAHILSAITFVPTAAAVILALWAHAPRAVVRTVGAGATALALLLTIRALSLFDQSKAAMQLVERWAWVPSLKADYVVGLDGISAPLLLLTALVIPLALLGAWQGPRSARLYTVFVLLLESGAVGAFTAQSFFHWFLYWELVLVPAFFLTKLWGGPKRDAASLKFFLYTLVGSVAMLLSFQAIYLVTGTLDFAELARLGQSGEIGERLTRYAAAVGLDWSASTCSALAFGGIMFACAVKTPMWPFHTWLPDAYSEAPTPTTMILTGIMSKMGVYAILRIALPIFPDLAINVAHVLLVLAVITVVAGALSAWAQTDLKRMLAYSSINHVGTCLVGIFAALSVTDAAHAQDRAAALSGVVMQMFNHGITAATMFFLLGILERQTGRRGLDDFGGLRKVMPVFSLLFGLTLFASVGLPGLNGFVSELLIFRGVLGLSPAAAVVSTLGLVVTAVFLLTVMQRVWSGPVNDKWATLTDLPLVPRVGAGLMVLLMFAVGLWPGPLVELSRASVNGLVDVLGHVAAGGGR